MSQKEDFKEEEEKVKLVIKDQDGAKIEYSVKKSTNLQKVLSSFAQETQRNINDLRLTFRGKILGSNVTPFDLRLEDWDELVVVASQTGGK